MTESQVETLTLVYAGRRLPKAGAKPNHAWYRPENLDDDLTFGPQSAGAAIGGLYTVDGQTNDSGGVSIYPSTIRFTGERIDDTDRIATWQAVDQETRSHLALQAGERKYAQSAELERALEPLIRLTQSARTRGEATAIRNAVVERLNEAWWKR